MRVAVTPEQVREVFGRYRDSPTFEESSRLLAQGQLPAEMLQAMCLRPEILDAFAATGAGVYPGGLLERPLQEVILRSSQNNECQFCTNAHRSIMGMLGIPQAQIEELDNPAHLTPRERLALDYTDAAMADSNRIDEALFEQLRGHFSDPEIVELTFLVGFINLLNLFNNALRVTYRGEYVAADEDDKREEST